MIQKHPLGVVFVWFRFLAWIEVRWCREEV